LDEFDSARGLYEPQDHYVADYDETSDLIAYQIEDDVRTCPACRGRCYEDAFEDDPCSVCFGDGVVPN
jgi:hypothetical protein